MSLRGILAYLDDRLTPESAAQVSEYLKEHDKARQLVDRIKRVIRRRRLSTPDLADRTEMPPLYQDDPNEVAAFLDGMMNSEQEADFEEICIDTDVYLAEVAACHQIMTYGTLSVKVPPLARQRMYSLVSGPEAQPLRVVPREPRASKPPLWEVSDGAPAHPEEENQAILEPLYHTILESRWRQGLVAVGAILMAVIIGFIFWSIPWNKLPASNEPIEVANHQPVIVEKNPAVPAEKEPVKPVIPEVKKPEVKTELVWPVAIVSREGQPNWQLAAQSIAGISGMVAARPALPFNVLLGLGEETGPNEALMPLPPVKAVKTRIAAPDRTTRVPIAVNGADGAGMFFQENTGDDWRLTKPQAQLLSNEKMMALPGYTGHIAPFNGVRLILLGQFSPNLQANPYAEAIVELHPTQEADLDFTLYRGRLALQGRAVQQVPAVVRVRYCGETWLITLPSGSEAGIQARGSIIPGDGPWNVMQSLEIICSKGTIDVSHEDQQAKLTLKQRLSWNSRLPEGKPAEQTELGELPIWIAKYQTAPKEAFESLVGLRSRTHAKLQKSGRDLNWFALACDEVLEEGKPIDRQAAMLGMSTIDRLKPLIALQNDMTANGRRKYSHEVIHHWLDQDADRAQILLDQLKEAGYSDEEGKLLLALYRGTTVNNPATLQALLQDMAHARVAIREQAWQVLTALAPERPNIFDPAGAEEQRLKAIDVISKKLAQQRKPVDVPPP